MINESIITNDCIDICKEYKKYHIKFKNKKIIITGGAGFLLSYFCDLVYILNSQYKLNVKLIIYDKFVFGFPARLKKFKVNKNIKFIEKDFSKKFYIDTKCDFFIHGASIASPTYYRKFPIDTIKTNVVALINILDEIFKKNKSIKSFIFMSSSEVYGDPNKKFIPTQENYNGNVSFTGPRACYDESKRIGETICVNYWFKKKIPIKIIRPFNVFGPGQNLNDKRIIPDIMNSLSKKKNINLFSDGTPKRSLCYISDQIRGIINIMLNGKNGHAYNGGNNEMLSISTISKLFLKISRVPVKILLKKSNDKNYTKDNPQSRCPDLNKINKVKNWKPIISTKQGIKRTLLYYNILK